MLKANEFEHGVDDETITYNNGKSILHDEWANRQFKYHGTTEELLNDKEMISAFIETHYNKQVPRLKLLHNYYRAFNTNVMQTNRRRETHLSDHRAAHDFAGYISNFINGYFLGKPITYSHVEQKSQDFVDEFNKLNDIDTLNREIGLDLSQYGRAYEYVYRNKKDQIRVYHCDVTETFIIYNNEAEQDSLLAVRYYPLMTNKESERNTFIAELISDKNNHKHKTSIEEGFNLTEYEPPKPHFFNKVPITEFSNNIYRMGDYEKVITQIDLYDEAQSDTANYMTDLNDALLYISGNTEMTTKEAADQKKANILHLVPAEYEDTEGKVTEGRVDAKYLYKQYDVQGSEAYKSRIRTDIHTFTNTPDLTDEKFAGAQSGESMKYKLTGLELNAVNKEGLFKKALRRRYRLAQHIAQVNSELDKAADLRSLDFTFTRNLPKSLLEELKAYLDAGGEISQNTLMKLFPSIIASAEDEQKKVADEEKEQIKRSNKQAYDDDIFNDKVDDTDGKE
ncbi:phage portal protein [Salinicoccus sp. HZC-1]|uniref:phage portal protein n=1 Tax=Salinicoccus sp. HZC-1 TaxID=3385497 RepID=UPI00398B523F